MPAMLGTQEAIRQSQAKERRERHRARRCNLIVYCVKYSLRSHELNGCHVVLKNNKLYVDIGSRITPDNDDDSEAGFINRMAKDEDEPDESNDGHDGNEGNTQPRPHPFQGYFLPYPDSAYEGLVTTITSVAPILNWIYVDKDTYQIKYGLRVDAQPHITGPFDCTEVDRRMTLDGWEGFVAVEEDPHVWALYFDRDDNGLKGKIPKGTRVLEVILNRRERKKTKALADEERKEKEALAEQKQQQRDQQEQQSQDDKGIAAESPQQNPEQEPTKDNQDDQKVAAAKLPTPQPTPQKHTLQKTTFSENPIIASDVHQLQSQVDDVFQKLKQSSSGGEEGADDKALVDNPINEALFTHRPKIMTQSIDSILSPSFKPADKDNDEEQDTVGTPTDLGASSIWSNEKGEGKDGKRIVSIASSVISEGEIAVNEADLRQNSKLGE